MFSLSHYFEMSYTFKLFISFFLFQIVYGQQVIVDTSRGSAIGFHFDQGNNKSALYYGQADVFLGVPFAQPPVGSLRFSVSIFWHFRHESRHANFRHITFAT
jgi:hypothetical protein